MDLSIITEYISPIILVACLGIGYTLHTLNNKILNSFIPIISASIGILAAIWSFGIVDLNTVVIGMISGLASTGMYEAFKNIIGLPATYADAMAIPEIQYGDSVDDTDDFLQGKHFTKE